MRRWARTHGMTLVGGSITERREGREKLSNTCLVFDPEGELVATYRKIHLFDVEVGGLTYRESEAEEHGEEPVVAEVEGWPVGLTICYDLRFPELYRVLALEGALLATVPAHFTLYTGKDHWHLLLRARAVENGFYVAAPAQVGETGIGRPSYGRSLIVDPWGTVLAQAPDEETVISAELDRAWLEEVRRRLPSLSQRAPGGVPLADARRDAQRPSSSTSTSRSSSRGPTSGPRATSFSAGASGSSSTRRATPRPARPPSRRSSATRSSTTTRRSGCCSPSGSSAAWAGTRTAPTSAPSR